MRHINLQEEEIRPFYRRIIGNEPPARPPRPAPPPVAPVDPIEALANTRALLARLRRNLANVKQELADAGAHDDEPRGCVDVPRARRSA